jgi:prolyl 4-hydroxylase
MLRRTRRECSGVLQKVAALSGLPLERLEDPQVARFTSGQLYEPHYDGPHPKDPDGKAFISCGGQRILSVVIYLNDVRRGGATRFNQLDIDVEPRRGVALVYCPAFLDGRLDPKTQHEDRPAEDTKWICQIWGRQRKDPRRVFINNED